MIHNATEIYVPVFTARVYKGVRCKGHQASQNWWSMPLLELKMKTFVFLTAYTSVALSFTATKFATAGSLSLSFTCHAHAAPPLSFNNLYRLTTGFWDNFIYPNNLKQLLSVNSTLFSEDVVGRVDDSRTFYGRELNTEYVFGSFATLGNTSSIVSVLGVPISHETTRFATNGNIVSVTELVFFNISLIGKVVPVQIDLWLAFNSQEEIVAYDTSFRWFAWLFDDMLQLLGESQSSKSDRIKPNTTLKSKIIQQICRTALKHCTDSQNLQYKNKSQCIEFLSQNVRLGTSYEFGMNTILCRSLHQLMVPLRPDVHCSHIGPTGGDMCVDDINYEAVVRSSIVGRESSSEVKNLMSRSPK